MTRGLCALTAVGLLPACGAQEAADDALTNPGFEAGQSHCTWTFAACAVLACCSVAAPRAAADDLSSHFAHAPEDALIRKLEPTTSSELPSGLRIVRRYRWLPGLEALLIESAVRNAGNTAIAPRDIPVVDLAFRVRPREEDAPYEKLTYRNEEWYDSTFWTGPDWTRVGKNWHHPGQNTPSVRCFRAPRDGRLTISGRVYKLHQDGDGVRLMIRHGDREIWSAEIDGADGTGVEPSLTLDARQGDAIRFIVHKRGAITCDTTYWDPIVTYADGESFQASSSFSTTRQGEGGWSYEMLVEERDASYARLTYRDEQWYGSTFWTGPDWTRVGTNWHHPGEQTPSVRCFQAPRDGRVTVSGRVYKLHQDGDGVRLLIRHGEHDIWGTEIEGADGEGVEPALTLDVRRGDLLRFIVHKRGAISCDTTHWDPVITYGDGATFQASKGFSTERQGEGGWFYELCRDAVTQVRWPSVHGLSADLCLWEETMLAGQRLDRTDREALPFFVAADGPDESGVALALSSTGPWRFRSELTAEGLLHVVLTVGDEQHALALEPGRTVSLPPAVLAAYTGPWTSAAALLQRLLDSDAEEAGLNRLREQVTAAYDRATASLARRPDLDLLLMAQAEWRREDKIADTGEAYATAVSEHLEKARQLLAQLQDGRPDSFLADHADRLERLRRRAEQPAASLDDWRRLYLQTRLLKREIALSNPLLDFDKLLFCKRVPTSYSHLVMQYYGWRARPGGGLFMLERPGYSLVCRSILADRLPPGNILEPRLSYDAERIVFSYVKCPDQPYRPAELPVNEEGPDEGYYHIYEVNADGTGLRQLTRGPYDDTMPAYLPDGGIAFCSTRRRGYARCFGGQFSRRWDSYTVHRMDGDGGNIRALSLNDVSEWFPAVSNSGRLLYARWDYIDRDAVTHQNLWAMRPDGSNPVAVWGNASPKPHCMFQAKPIPNSGKIVFTASAHHSITAGPICVLDPTADNNDLRAIKRITPGPFPEAEGWGAPDYYTSPWPLSEEWFLVAYSPTRLRPEGQAPNARNALGIYLLDAAGNRELIYRDPDIGSTNPTPLAPRPTPPVLASALPPSAPPSGEMVLVDVYEGLGDIPRGSIEELRLIQIFPKTTPLANQPPIGLAGEENARAILGTVPVDPDGSARFLVPAHKPILFQALDEDGFAYQTMRSLTYVQPGERVSCVGCHERGTTTPPHRRPTALRRAPSPIAPGELGGEPFSFMRVVQPVLDQHCVGCHSGDKPPKGLDLTPTPRDGFTRSYWSLCGDAKEFWAGKTNPENAAQALVPRFGARNQVQMTPPGGVYGALGSRLIRMLREGHKDVKLNAADLRRLAAWIDCNAIFYGAYDPARQADQLAGKALDMPAIQ